MDADHERDTQVRLTEIEDDEVEVVLYTFKLAPESWPDGFAYWSCQGLSK